MSYKTKAFVRMIKSQGAMLARKRGDHWTYKLPNGAVISIPVGGTQNDVSPALVAEYYRRRKGRRIR